MKKPLPTSSDSDDFEHVISSNNYYVDKTYFVEELLQAGTQVTLITRPRRFGKMPNKTAFYSKIYIFPKPHILKPNKTNFL